MYLYVFLGDWRPVMWLWHTTVMMSLTHMLDVVLTFMVGVHHILSHSALCLLLCSTHNTNAECCRKEN